MKTAASPGEKLRYRLKCESQRKQSLLHLSKTLGQAASWSNLAWMSAILQLSPTHSLTWSWARPGPALEALPAVLMSPLAPADSPPSTPGGLSWAPAPPLQRRPQTSPLRNSLFLTTAASDVNQALLSTSRRGQGAVLDNCVV